MGNRRGELYDYCGLCQGIFLAVSVAEAVETRQSPAVSLISGDDAGEPRGPRGPEIAGFSVSSGCSVENSSAHLQEETT